MSTAAEDPSLISTLSSGRLYKRTQGRMVRQVTLAVLLSGVLLGCFRLSEEYLQESGKLLSLGVPAILFLAGAWFVYRLTHWPQFADFLVHVQGELDKVNWATWEYLIRATGVVLVTMVIAAAFLWVCDFAWIYLFESIGFLRVQKS
jgi:preprotein translocase subunit SecE